MCSTDEEVSGAEANQADADLPLAKPSEEPRADTNISLPVQVASAAPVIESITDSDEDLLEGIQFSWEEFPLPNTFVTDCLAFCVRRGGLVSPNGSADGCKVDG